MNSFKITAVSVLSTMLCAASVFGSISADVQQTFGDHDYKSTDVFVDLGFGPKEGPSYHIQPYMSAYSSDFSSSTYKTFSVRLSRETSHWDGGVTFGGTPETDDYSSRFFGIDGTAYLGTEDAEKGPGFAGGDVGASLLHTVHQDELFRDSGGIVQRRTDPDDIRQTDLGVSAGASLFWSRLSGHFTRSLYDQDLDNDASGRANPLTHLPGADSIVAGFPTNRTGVRLAVTAIPFVSPFIAYTRTTYELDTPTSNAVTVGATAGFGPVDILFSYERLDLGDEFEKQDYVTFGAGLKF